MIYSVFPKSIFLAEMYRNDPKFSDTQALTNMQTQIRRRLEEQSDKGLYCLSFHLHFVPKDLFI